MNWQDEGFILSKRKFRENAIILEVFTNEFGKVNGIVYGGTSRKVKNYLQLTNKIFIVNNTKNENKIGYFKTELIEAVAPKYFDDKNKILCLNSVSSMLKVLLPENQKYKNIYSSLSDFFNSLDQKNWLINYLFWEINLITNLGFGFQSDIKSVSGSNVNNIYNFKIDNIEYKIPAFLISKDFRHISQQELYQGLFFCRSLMENKFFNPNNLKFPKSRRLLENKFITVN
tara:strand:- start:250 stop:936 length:687 start_codon:yes stop_codon:yes gene_type:complete